MLRDTTIDNNWWYTECQATYNIRSIDSSNAIIHFTRICACLVGGNKNEDMTNTTADKVIVVNLMDVSIQGDCRPVTLQACYFDILTFCLCSMWYVVSDM